MKIFKVKIYETIVSKGILTVKANDEDEAEDIAREQYEEGIMNSNDSNYTPTTECDDGGVEFTATEEKGK
jgi:hypothetical protein